MADVRFRVFLKAFTLDTAARMSGPLSVPFAALALILNSYSRIIFGCLAVFSGVLASYRVWRNERLAAAQRLSEQRAEAASHIAAKETEMTALSQQLASYTSKLNISVKVEGEPPSQFIRLIAADGKIKLHRVDYMTTEESTLASDEVSVEEGAIKYPVNRDLLVKVWNTPRANRNAYDHSGPAKIGLTVSAKNKSCHLILPVQMSQTYQNTAQGTIAYIQVTGSKIFFDL